MISKKTIHVTLNKDFENKLRIDQSNTGGRAVTTVLHRYLRIINEEKGRISGRFGSTDQSICLDFLRPRGVFPWLIRFDYDVGTTFEELAEFCRGKAETVALAKKIEGLTFSEKMIYLCLLEDLWVAESL